MSIEQRVSKRLRALIQKRKTTAEQVAFVAGISKSYLSAILRGQKSPTIRTLAKLAEALDVDIRDLF